MVSQSLPLIFDWIFKNRLNLMSNYSEGHGGVLQWPVCEERPNEPLGAKEAKKRYCIGFLKTFGKLVMLVQRVS